MTPAAIHRYTGARLVTEHFIRNSTRLLVLGMYPLAFGICIDFYLIARIITHAPILSFGLSLLLFITIMFLWVIFPRWRHKKHKEDEWVKIRDAG
jgi:hypothetical protein